MCRDSRASRRAIIEIAVISFVYCWHIWRALLGSLREGGLKCAPRGGVLLIMLLLCLKKHHINCQRDVAPRGPIIGPP